MKSVEIKECRNVLRFLSHMDRAKIEIFSPKFLTLFIFDDDLMLFLSDLCQAVENNSLNLEFKQKLIKIFYEDLGKMVEFPYNECTTPSPDEIINFLGNRPLSEQIFLKIIRYSLFMFTLDARQPSTLEKTESKGKL